MSEYNNDPALWAFYPDTVNYWSFWNNALTDEECDKVIALGNSLELKEGTLQSEDNNDIRNSSISWIRPNSETAWLFKKVSTIVTDLNARFFGFDIFGMGEGFQFTKYEAPSGHYSKHVDFSAGNHVRKLSVVIQLSDPSEYEGGDFLIHVEDGNKMSKAKGHMIVFPSFMAHEVLPVTQGTRYSLVSWITGKPFR